MALIVTIVASAMFVCLTFTSIKCDQRMLVHVMKTLVLNVPLIQRFMRIKLHFLDAIHFIS